MGALGLLVGGEDRLRIQKSNNIGLGPLQKVSRRDESSNQVKRPDGGGMMAYTLDQ